MNPDYEQQLEAEIDRRLKRLRELQAPATLVSRVMSAIERPVLLPWYRQSWQMWPLPLRAASLLALIAAFAGICFGSWELTQTESFVAATHTLGAWFTSASALFHALSALAGAVLVAVKSLGTGFLIACLLAGAMAYAMCLGLGTVYLRLAWPRR